MSGISISIRNIIMFLSADEGSTPPGLLIACSDVPSEQNRVVASLLAEEQGGRALELTRCVDAKSALHSL